MDWTISKLVLQQQKYLFLLTGSQSINDNEKASLVPPFDDAEMSSSCKQAYKRAKLDLPQQIYRFSNSDDLLFSLYFSHVPLLCLTGPIL